MGFVGFPNNFVAESDHDSILLLLKINIQYLLLSRHFILKVILKRLRDTGFSKEGLYTKLKIVTRVLELNLRSVAKSSSKVFKGT